MSDKSKPKPENNSALRIPKAKRKLGLAVPQIRMPHEELLRPLPEMQNPVTAFPTLPSQTTRQKKPLEKLDGEKNQISHIAPLNDFQKVPNSLTKEAIPAGYFRGKDKQLYDVLYSLTRGAINPTRIVRLNKKKLMQMASIGSRITFDKSISHLENIGLLKMAVLSGQHNGNEFEIFIPEEVSAQTNHSLNVENNNVSTFSKTSFKTHNIDDDTHANFAELNEIFANLTIKLTGKKPTSADSKKWAELGEVLAAVCYRAGQNTNSISSIPAFLKSIIQRTFFGREENRTQRKPQTGEIRKIEESAKIPEEEVKWQDAAAAFEKLSELEKENLLEKETDEINKQPEFIEAEKKFSRETYQTIVRSEAETRIIRKLLAGKTKNE